MLWWQVVIVTISVVLIIATVLNYDVFKWLINLAKEYKVSQNQNENKDFFNKKWKIISTFLILIGLIFADRKFGGYQFGESSLLTSQSIWGILTAIGTLGAAWAAILAANKAQDIANNQTNLEAKKYTLYYCQEAISNNVIQHEYGSIYEQLSIPYIYVPVFSAVALKVSFFKDTSIREERTYIRDELFMNFVQEIFQITKNNLSCLTFVPEYQDYLAHLLLLINEEQINKIEINKYLREIYEELKNKYNKDIIIICENFLTIHRFFFQVSDKFIKCLEKRERDSKLIQEDILDEKIYCLSFQDNLKIEEHIIRYAFKNFNHIEASVISDYPNAIKLMNSKHINKFDF